MGKSIVRTDQIQYQSSLTCDLPRVFYHLHTVSVGQILTI